MSRVTRRGRLTHTARANVPPKSGSGCSSARPSIVRTAAFFSPIDHHGFLTHALREVSAGREMLAADDVVVSPTYVPHLVDAVLDLLIDGERGVWHLANDGQVSWADFAALAARLANLDDSLVRRVPVTDLGLRACRPAFSALDSERGKVMPTLESGVTEYLASPINVWRERQLRISCGIEPQVARRRQAALITPRAIRSIDVDNLGVQSIDINRVNQAITATRRWSVDVGSERRGVDIPHAPDTARRGRYLLRDLRTPIGIEQAIGLLIGVGELRVTEATH